MANRRTHYIQAFEHYLRERGFSYVSVEDAQRQLHAATGQSGSQAPTTSLKNFDFVIYGQHEHTPNLLVAIKGRKFAATTGTTMQNWVGKEDVRDLAAWAERFGAGFEPAFVFVYWCDEAPANALFLDTFAYGARWYAPLAIRLSDYAPHLRDRSAKWGTVHIPTAVFNQYAQPVHTLMTPDAHPDDD